MEVDGSMGVPSEDLLYDGMNRMAAQRGRATGNYEGCTMAMNEQKPMRLVKRRTNIKLCAHVGLVGAMALVSGCVSYTNVPVPESAPAFESANHRQSVEVIVRALEAVIGDHPVVGAYAINLPMGTTPETAQKIVRQLPEGAIVPFDGMDDSVPMYSIGRVWIRLSDAKVDVVYPFMRADGVNQDQSVTIWLNGGVRAWRVNRQQHWSPGTVATPGVYIPIWPDPSGQDESMDAQGVDAQGDVDESIDVESMPDEEPGAEILSLPASGADGHEESVDQSAGPEDMSHADHADHVDHAGSSGYSQVPLKGDE